MSERTTIVLGAAGRRAAARLAKKWGVTTSEAIRRAVVRVAGEEIDTERERRRRRRVAALASLVQLFENVDADAELQRIQEERDAW